MVGNERLNLLITFRNWAIQDCTGLTRLAAMSYEDIHDIKLLINNYPL